MDKPMQFYIEGIANDVWDALPVTTRREVVKGWYSAHGSNSHDIADAGKVWLEAQFPTYVFRVVTVGEHTRLIVGKWALEVGAGQRSGEAIVELFSEAERTIEFVSPQLFAKISLVCG